MPELKNDMYERFCQLVFAGAKPTPAYLEVGFKKGTNPSSGAGKLLKRPDILARLAELRGNVSAVVLAKAGMDRLYVLDKLKLIIENKEEPAAARVRSLELAGKELGMFIDRAEIRTGDLDRMTPEQLKARLEMEQQKLAELKAMKASLGEGDNLDPAQNASEVAPPCGYKEDAGDPDLDVSVH